MKRITLFLIFLSLVLHSSAQEISRLEADSMLSLLNKTQSDTTRIEVLLNIALFHIYKPGEYKIDLDSAAFYIDEAKVLNKIVHSPNTDGYLLMTESCLIKERGAKAAGPSFYRSEGGQKIAEQAVSILQTGTNKEYLGQACFELSYYYDFNDSLQLPKKISLIRQAIDAFQAAGDLKRKGRSLEMLGDLYLVGNEMDKSLLALNEALATYNSVNYQKLQGVYVLLGKYYNSTHDYVPALSNLLKARKAAQSNKDSSMQLCQINNHLGMTYNEIDRLDMAVKYLNDGLEIAMKHGDEDAVYWLVINLSTVYNNLGQPDESLKVLGYIPKKYRLSEDPIYKTGINSCYLKTYLGLGRLNDARPCCDIIVYMADKKIKDDDEKRARIYMYAAKFYFKSNQYAKARYFLAKSDRIAKQINYDFSRIHNLELSHKLDSAEGNFKSAYDHLLLFKEKTDSISGERKARQFQVMNVEYEVEMKEDSINQKNKEILLLTQKNDLQQENLKQAGFIRNITGGGIVLALIFIGLLYRQYRQKQKSNQLITQKNKQLQHLLTEKDWLVKEIHHRVKNNLQMVISLLSAQTEFLTHPSAIDAVRESRERMEAIAIIHQKLYQLDNSTLVNMGTYVTDLVDNIKNSFADSDRIEFKVDIMEVSLDISQSLPLGLILNEAITNAIKYAFKANEMGLIQISLKQRDNDTLQLRIADNGKGLPADVDVKNSNSLGIKLIRLFSEQLEGDLYFINNNGLEIILNFKAAGYPDVTIIKSIA